MEIQQFSLGAGPCVVSGGLGVIYTRPPVRNPCGTLIFVQTLGPNSVLRKATMGGVVVVNGQFYGTIACHASDGRLANDSSFSSGDDAELVIEDDDKSSTNGKQREEPSFPPFEL
jgi:hypothetical protein